MWIRFKYNKTNKLKGSIVGRDVSSWTIMWQKQELFIFRKNSFNPEASIHSWQKCWNCRDV